MFWGWKAIEIKQLTAEIATCAAGCILKSFQVEDHRTSNCIHFKKLPSLSYEIEGREFQIKVKTGGFKVENKTIWRARIGQGGLWVYILDLHGPWRCCILSSHRGALNLCPEINTVYWWLYCPSLNHLPFIRKKLGTLWGTLGIMFKSHIHLRCCNSDTTQRVYVLGHSHLHSQRRKSDLKSIWFTAGMSSL